MIRLLPSTISTMDLILSKRISLGTPPVAMKLCMRLPNTSCCVLVLLYVNWQYLE